MNSRIVFAVFIIYLISIPSAYSFYHEFKNTIKSKQKTYAARHINTSDLEVKKPKPLTFSMFKTKLKNPLIKVNFNANMLKIISMQFKKFKNLAFRA